MNKFNLSKIAKSIRTATIQHSPEILTGIGIAGMFTTAVLAVKATPKALSLVDDKVYTDYKKSGKDCSFAEYLGVTKDYCWGDRKNMLTNTEIVKLTWKCYIPAAVTCAASTACLIGANSVNTRRNAVLATAYNLSRTALTEYQEKVVETIGEKKEQLVRDSIAKDHIDNDRVSTHEVIITEKGNTLCYDSVSGQYFKSDIEKIRKAENVLNKQLMTEMYIPLNDLYYELGLKQTTMGTDLGWNISGGLIEFDFSSVLTEDGDPCLVLDYRVAPRYNYTQLM